MIGLCKFFQLDFIFIIYIIIHVLNLNLKHIDLFIFQFLLDSKSFDFIDWVFDPLFLKLILFFQILYFFLGLLKVASVCGGGVLDQDGFLFQNILEILQFLAHFFLLFIKDFVEIHLLLKSVFLDFFFLFFFKNLFFQFIYFC